MKQSINWFVGMIFVISSWKLHLLDNFWTLKTLNITIYVKQIEKLKEAVEKYKNQKNNHSVLAKIYIVYIICTPKCHAFRNNFFPLLSIIECYKPNRWWMFYFLYSAMHSTRIVFTSFGNLVDVLHDYQWFRLVLALRWSRYWYCPFLALMALN